VATIRELELKESDVPAKMVTWEGLTTLATGLHLQTLPGGEQSSVTPIECSSVPRGDGVVMRSPL
jgi:hypothetical protein